MRLRRRKPIPHRTPSSPVGPTRLTVGQRATLACLLEVSAPKPGNVHRGADFDDLTFEDFATSAVAIGPVLDRAGQLPLGRVVLDAISATQAVVQTNTNLGIVLLIAPLAAVPPDQAWGSGIAAVLNRLTPSDAADVYAAIQLARAGGLGTESRWDVHGTPPPDLLAAMRAAADRDLIARQYVTNFSTVLETVVPSLLANLNRGWRPAEAIVRSALQLMAAEPDSLIGRKCGREIAEQSARYAAVTLDAGEPGDENYHEALADLDFWLRSDGHRRNPGTTADLIAAALFVVLRDMPVSLGLVQR